MSWNDGSGHLVWPSRMSWESVFVVCSQCSSTGEREAMIGAVGEICGTGIDVTVSDTALVELPSFGAWLSVTVWVAERLESVLTAEFSVRRSFFDMSFVGEPLLGIILTDELLAVKILERKTSTDASVAYNFVEF